MATQFEIDCALMAGASYISTRSLINQFPVPQGWTSFFPVPDPTTASVFPVTAGFEAVSFTNGTDIVISFAGTYDKSPADYAADALLGAGFVSDQLLQAAEYYIQVKMANPSASITFTGHSLGGGLAALLGVFFNQTAVTFDQAPFLNSATLSIAISVMSDLIAKFPPATNIQVTGILKPLADFIGTTNLLTDNLAARASNVSGLNTQGEFLSVAPLTIFSKIGAQTLILHGPTDVAGTDLHAQSLLTAFLQSQQTATTGQALNDVTYKLTDLLGMIFDTNLYAHDTDTDKQNFLEHLVKDQAAQSANPALGEVTRFTTDLWKLAQDGGMTMSESATYSNWNNVSKTLIAFAMQKYYDEKAGSIAVGETLFKDVTGGIRFDTEAVAGSGNSIIGAKGYTQYFLDYLDNTSLLTPDECTLVKSILPVLKDWYVQAGTAGMDASDTANRNAYMLGGSGSDNFTGGTADDLLVGNAGDDILTGGAGADTLMGGAGDDNLTGGAGADTLIGGAGNDTYYADTTDTIRDSDGQGAVYLSDQQLTNARRKKGETAYMDKAGNSYVLAGTTLLCNRNCEAGNNSEWRDAA